MAIPRNTVMIATAYTNIMQLIASDNYVVCNKNLVKNLGANEAILIGLLGSKFQYYLKENKLEYFDNKPYFFCTQSTIEDEIGFKETVLRNAIKHLVEVGILEVVKKKIPARNYYYINAEVMLKYLYDQSLENLGTGDEETTPPEARKPSLSNKEYSKKENNKNNYIKNKQKSDLAKTSTGNGLELIREKITSKKGAAADQAVEQVISHLNSLANTRYRPTKADTIKLISARLKEGYSVDDLKLVVSYKCDEWMGTDMQKYLRPETLFRPSKFEGYLNAATSGAPARKRASNADTSSGKKVSTAFRDLSETERKKNLSGLKF